MEHLLTLATVIEQENFTRTINHYDYILRTVKEEFERECFLDDLNTHSIFLYYFKKTGQFIFHDQFVKHDIIQRLFEDKKIKIDCDAFHQLEPSIRYRFTGYKYDRKYYRQIPYDLRKKIYERDFNECVVCRAGYPLSVDHKIPWSLGGLTIENNLQTLCRRCNTSKGNR